MEQKTVTISVKKLFKWFFGLLLLLALGIFLYNITNNSLGLSRGYSNEGIPTLSFSDDRSSSSITDTREFMKTSYSGNIQSRDVKDTTRDVRGIIRDSGGRIDSEDVNEKFGYISFVVPKSELNNFLDEISTIAHKKLYSEGTSSQNLLSQKQNIEEQGNIATQSIIELQNNLKATSVRETATLANLNRELVSVRNQFNATKKTIAETVGNNPELLTDLYLQEYQQQEQVNQIMQTIENEKIQYKQQKNALEQKISESQKVLQGVTVQDSKFNENIETVEGSITIRWISLWKLMTVFSPINPIFIISILLVLFWYLLRKLNKVPMIVFKW